jgi:hypothetical protein
MKNKYYQETITLNHNELPAKINVESGEVKAIEKRKNNLPRGKEPFGIEEIGWPKDFTRSLKFLTEVLSPTEMMVVIKMIVAASANTNCIIPFNHSSSLGDLSKEFGTDYRRTKAIFGKLFELGVYGQFLVSERDRPYTKYWILNPYLSFAGKLIGTDIKNLFQNTILTQEYYKNSSQ